MSREGFAAVSFFFSSSLDTAEQVISQEISLRDFHSGNEECIVERIEVEFELVLESFLEETPLEPLRIVEDVKQCVFVDSCYPYRL